MNVVVQSRIADLQCPECGKSFDAGRLQTICQECNSPLLVNYNLTELATWLSPNQVNARRRGLWRWAELLPVDEPAMRLSLGEGDTPLLSVPALSKQLGMPNLWIKDESMNPTGSFKARGLVVAVARAIELGVNSFVMPTAGNAGGALATYASRAGCSAHIYMPVDAPRINQEEVSRTGADLHLVPGFINDAARIAAQESAAAASSGDRWFDLSTFKEPYRVEGKKTMGLELAEAFNYELPDVIIYPTGGGTGLVGMWKAFAELQALGWVGKRRPRMVSVQAEGCAPIVRAFQSGASRAQLWENAHTLASGLRVPQVFADRLILRVIHESSGTAVAVSDQEIQAAQQRLARTEGIFAAPEGAASLAAVFHLRDSGWLQPGDTVVLFNTGSGLKYVN